MKKTIGTVGVIVLLTGGLKLSAQTNWEAQKNPTVDSITAKYKDKLVAVPAPRTTDHVFPVIGTYEPVSNTDAGSLSISLDAANKGLIWIEGLPQGKIKGLLTKSPATYKIPAQKTVDSKDLPEGTLLFNKETGTLSICIGKPYNSAHPELVFTENLPETQPVATKGKKTKQPATPKAWMYTGRKLEKETAGN